MGPQSGPGGAQEHSQGRSTTVTGSGASHGPGSAAPEPANASSRDPSGDDIERHRKRRKLDHGPQAPISDEPQLRYGYRGSAVPGRLRMQVASCDGGTCKTLTIHEQQYGPENILRNDRSVYCTSQGQCNIVLQHPGGINFSLTKIIVRAPKSGFNAP